MKKRSMRFWLCFFFFFFFFFFSLVGCQPAEEFNQQRVFNQFHSAGVMYVPHSRYIKKQTITTRVDGRLGSTVTIEMDNAGRLIAFKRQQAEGILFNAAAYYNYPAQTFALQDAFTGVHIQQGKMVFDDNQRLVGLLATTNDGQRYQVSGIYQAEKLIASHTKIGNRDLDLQIIWQGDYITGIRQRLFHDENTLFEDYSGFTFDKQGRLMSAQQQYRMFKIQLPDFHYTFSDYNSAGDWTRATVSYSGLEGKNRTAA